MPIYCTWPISVTGYERNHFKSSIKILYILWIVFLMVGVEMWMVSKDFFYFLILSAALKAKIMWSTFLLLSETRSSRIFFSLFFKSCDSPKYINHCITSYFSLKKKLPGVLFQFWSNNSVLDCFRSNPHRVSEVGSTLSPYLREY